MKKLILSFVLLFLFSPTSFAKWEKKDTVFMVLELIDWAQSRTIATEKIPGGHPGLDGTNYMYYEGNPFLGTHPSAEKVDTYFSLCIIANYLVARYANDKFHKIWTYSAIMLELYSIQKNHSLGVRIKF